MAKRSFQVATWTPTATGDGTTYANGTFMSLGAGSTTQVLEVLEIYVGGQAPSTSSPCILQFARDLVLAATPTALAAPNGDGQVDGVSAAPATTPVACVQATTNPSRTNTATTARLNMSMNAFGGAVKYQANRGEGWRIVGTAVSVSESSLSAFTGGAVGLIGSHIIYEPY
jgi:hypothetical protein